MDELYKIRAFLDVVEKGSFSAAARQQEVSVSSIARRVAALEDDLGVRLISRNTRRISVTEAGKLFHQQVRQAVYQLDQAKAEVTTFQVAAKGLLRVSLRVSVGMMILPRIESFLDRNPDIVLDLSLTDERVDLIANNIDVALWIGQLEDSQLIAKRLSPGRRFVLGSPAYLARYGTPQTPEDLANHRCLPHLSADYDGRWRFTRDDRRWVIKAEGPFQSSSSLAIISAAVAGVGLVVLQQYTAQEEIKLGRLKPVLVDYDVSPTEADTAIYAVYPHSRHLSPKARAFVDFLTASFRLLENDTAVS